MNKTVIKEPDEINLDDLKKIADHDNWENKVAEITKTIYPSILSSTSVR